MEPWSWALNLAARLRMHGAYLHCPMSCLVQRNLLPLSLGVQSMMYESIACLCMDGVQHRSCCSCRGATVLFNHATINQSKCKRARFTLKKYTPSAWWWSVTKGRRLNLWNAHNLCLKLATMYLLLMIRNASQTATSLYAMQIGNSNSKTCWTFLVSKHTHILVVCCHAIACSVVVRQNTQNQVN